ncbi:hypothetical protein PBAT_19695 [Paenibacillus antarcticus]|uniref:Integrase SAM-like N-terminal domain-containing protein n=1 Tax=Paenibacillus antarcticus TaxID=253703 RepID=A0A168KZG6_9BACL|nr:hypothetical protein PBAT_19695 [Paenibacillus antarcticus]
MRVQEVILNDNKKRYLLLDAVGVPVVPVMKYLKYLDQTGKSNNTLKTYCYALKQYFTYLEERKIDYKEVGVKDLASRGEHYSARDQVPRAGTFDQATLILYENKKRINQKELVDLIIRWAG